MHKRTVGLVVMSVLGATLLVAGGRDLHLARYSLRSVQPAARVLKEAAVINEAEIYTTSMRVVRAMTWQEIGEDRGLSEPLVVESYACTNGVKRARYSTIGSIRVASGAVVTLVLKPGACENQARQ